MADQNINIDEVNRQLDEMSRLLAKATDEIHKLGVVSPETSKKMSKMFGSLKNDSYRLSSAFNNLTEAVASTAEKTYSGAKGASVLNNEMEKLADSVTLAGQALSLLLPGGIFVKAIAFAATTLVGTMNKVDTRLNSAARKMSDQLYSTYSDMAKHGAAAGDGLSGLFKDTKKLGLSIDEISALTRNIVENSRDFALLNGTVASSRKEFANIGKSLSNNREEFLRLGYSMSDVTDFMSSYKRRQVLLGDAQKQTIDEMAMSVREYVYETDKLTKLTGISRRDQEQMRQEAMTQEQYAAVINELRLKGDKESINRMDSLNTMMATIGPSVQKGIRAMFAGNILDEEAQKLTRTFGAVGIDINSLTEKVKTGQISSTEFMDTFRNGVTEFQKRMGTDIGKLNISQKYYISQLEASRAMTGTFSSSLVNAGKIAEQEQKEQKEASDDQIKIQAKIREYQIKGNEELETFIFKRIPDANQGMLNLVSSVNYVASEITRLFGKQVNNTYVDDATNRAMELADVASKPGASASVKKSAREADALAARAGMEQITAARSKPYNTSRRRWQLQNAENDVNSSNPRRISNDEASKSLSGDLASKLLNMIGRIESNNNYNVLVGGRTLPELSNMTLREVAELQAKMKSGAMGKFASTAVGKYQITDTTLAMLVSQGRANWDDKFNSATQDKLAHGLLVHRGLNRFMRGSMSKEQFMHALTQEWAALPGPDGKTYWKDGINKSGISRKQFEELFAKDGAVLSGPTSGYKPNVVMHGTEAIIPLQNQNVPVKITADSTIGQVLVGLDSTMKEILAIHEKSLLLLSEIDSNTNKTASSSEKAARHLMN